LHGSNKIEIDKVIIINLKKRKDRLKYCINDLIPSLPKELQEKVEIFEAIDRTNFESRNQRAAGCALSQAAVWKLCRERKYNRVLIFEDDVKPVVSQQEIYEYFDTIKTIDFALCALSYFKMSPLVSSKYDKFRHTHYFFHASAYIARVSSLNEMISTVEYNAGFLEKNYPIGRHAIDVVWHKFHNNRHKKRSFKTWLLTDKCLFLQRNLFSDIEGECVVHKIPKKSFDPVKFR